MVSAFQAVQDSINPSDVPHSPAQLSEEEKKLNHADHFVGYPGLADWMASSQDLFILRRFSPLAARTLLFLQHQIWDLNEKVEEKDRDARRKPLGEARADSFVNDPDEGGRKQKIMRAAELLQQYCER